MTELLRRWATPLGVLVVLALGYATYTSWKGRVAAEAVAAERTREAERLLAFYEARDSVYADSIAHLLAYVSQVKQRAALLKFRADSFHNALLAAVPDTSPVRELVEGFAETCRAQVSALEGALGTCERAQLHWRERLAVRDSTIRVLTDRWKQERARAHRKLIEQVLDGLPWAAGGYLFGKVF